MYFTDEQREIGKLNFLTALGQVRGDFLRQSLQTADIGSFYFGYPKLTGDPVRAGIVGTGNEGCEAMIMQSPPGFLRFVAYHDIRPTQIERAPRYFERLYGPEEGKKVKFHAEWKDLLNDPDVEAIVIATPLWTHADFAIQALNAGKHVLCEKLMAHNVRDSKAMVRAAEKSGKILSIGHQRHYSTLYDNALAVIRSGILGDIKHIRALWHRNNTWNKPDGTSGDSWTPDIPEADRSVDVARHGYKSIEELVRWRLFNRTGGGLMAELGSHQLDACSLFLNKVHPLMCSAVGGKYYFTDDRECEDHVYCTYQFPDGVVVTYSSINTNTQDGYGEIITGTRGTLLIMNERDVMLFKERAPGDKNPATDTHVALASQYQSPLEARKAALKDADPATAEKIQAEVTSLEGKVKESLRTGTLMQLNATPSLALTSEAALAKVALDHASLFTPPGLSRPMTNRGYREEMEAFASAVRNSGDVRCNGRVALADAVMALATNVALRKKRRIEFEGGWYDPASDEVPDGPQGVPLAQKP